jgi:ferredoxin
MPKVRLHHQHDIYEQDINENTNLVVLAGIKKFPYPYLKYGCGMGKCTKCKIRVLDGAEELPPPNWKEEKMLGDELTQGYRLACQLFIFKDIEIIQD